MTPPTSEDALTAAESTGRWGPPKKRQRHSRGGTWTLLIAFSLFPFSLGACSDDTAPSGNPSSDASFDAPDSPDSDAIETAEYPLRLSEAGLYADIRDRQLAEGVRSYAPQFELWSDGASKRRWVYLPAGEQIDTENFPGPGGDMSGADYWHYPVGTRLYKEFAQEGQAIETRMLSKRGPYQWTMIAYQWDPDGQDATAVPAGVSYDSGTGHDIPSQSQCRDCHTAMVDTILGFTAIQLAHEGDGVTLQTLMDEQRLTTNPASVPLVPGDEIERAAVGYLHANCGHCHNETSGTRVDLRLWLKYDQLARIEDTPAYLTTVGILTAAATDIAPYRIAPQNTELSAIYARMNVRDPSQMPPLGTERIDEIGLATIRAWIDSLPEVTPNAGTPITDSGTDSGPIPDAAADQ